MIKKRVVFLHREPSLGNCSCDPTNACHHGLRLGLKALISIWRKVSLAMS
jgi:hypothetical protein